MCTCCYAAAAFRLYYYRYHEQRKGQTIERWSLAKRQFLKEIFTVTKYHSVLTTCTAATAAATSAARPAFASTPPVPKRRFSSSRGCVDLRATSDPCDAKLCPRSCPCRHEQFVRCANPRAMTLIDSLTWQEERRVKVGTHLILYVTICYPHVGEKQHPRACCHCHSSRPLGACCLGCSYSRLRLG